MEEILKLYTSAGITGLVVVIGVWILTTYIKGLKPRIDEMERKLDLTTETIRQNNTIIERNLQVMSETKSTLENSQEVIKNNTEAILSFSKSLNFFTRTVTAVDTKVDLITTQFVSNAKKNKRGKNDDKEN